MPGRRDVPAHEQFGEIRIVILDGRYDALVFYDGAIAMGPDIRRHAAIQPQQRIKFRAEQVDQCGVAAACGDRQMKILIASLILFGGTGQVS